MEENGNAKPDLNGNLVRPQSLRSIGVVKSTSSGRSTPRSSPTYRRLNSVRTPRRDGRGSSGIFTQWFRNSRLVYWLLLITLWTYGGFYIQSRWAHGDNGENSVGFGNTLNDDVQDSVQNQLRRELIVNDGLVLVKNGSSPRRTVDVKEMSNNLDMVVAKKRNGTSPSRSSTLRKKGKKIARGKGRRKKKTAVEEDVIRGEEVQVEEIPLRNASYGLLLGPFGSIEDRVLEWSPEKRTGTCDRNELFARLVWSRNFVLIFHELSMTGAPLSMLELATELLSCGATVHAVVLSRRGGLMSELTRRRIKVIDDKAEHSFKAAMKADLVIAGSAVCALWIERYLAHFAAGSNQIAWWIMENRREYFDRSKLVLNRVKMLIFLSELQSKQWLAWSEEEKIKLDAQIALIPLSVNDELAFVAGLTSSLNTPRFTPETMLGKRQVLRNAVRQEMGLTDNDMLVLTLSSINAPKGQLLLLESAAHVIINEPRSHDHTGGKASVKLGQERANLTQRFRLRGLLQKDYQNGASLRGLQLQNRTNVALGAAVSNGKSGEQVPGQNLKLLIGSVGSKSNKVLYVKEILEFLNQNPNLSESVLWTPATTRVASLYSAADVYVINAQGLGETFGRVTIEAMAFGLPVLGTDAGGTKEIVEHNVTGLLHPIGRPGTRMLAENLKFLLRNPSARLQMGMKGRQKVEKMYMKRHMYKMFFEVLFKCMKVK